MKYVIKTSDGDYWLGRGEGLTPSIELAYMYDEDEIHLVCFGLMDLTMIPVPTEIYEAFARIECERLSTAMVAAAQHKATTSLSLQVDVVKGANARLVSELGELLELIDCQRGTIVEQQKINKSVLSSLNAVRRQNSDLQAANNALLQRARDAEAKIAAPPYVLTLDIDALARNVHEENTKWWTDPKTGKRIDRNKGEMIALMHSELSEMLEGVRKDSMDDHLPEWPSEIVELADLFIRALDYSGAYNFRLGAVIAEKRAFNRRRDDHTFAARLALGGKKF